HELGIKVAGELAGVDELQRIDLKRSQEEVLVTGDVEILKRIDDQREGVRDRANAVNRGDLVSALQRQRGLDDVVQVDGYCIGVAIEGRTDEVDEVLRPTRAKADRTAVIDVDGIDDGRDVGNAEAGDD